MAGIDKPVEFCSTGVRMPCPMQTKITYEDIEGLKQVLAEP